MKSVPYIPRSAVIGDDRDRDRDRGTAGPRIKNRDIESTELSRFFPSSITAPAVMVFFRIRPRPRPRPRVTFEDKSLINASISYTGWVGGADFWPPAKSSYSYEISSIFLCIFIAGLCFFYRPKNWYFFEVKKMVFLNYYRDCDSERERKTAKTFHAVMSRFLERL